MVQRDVVVRCPGCGRGKTVPLAIGQLLQCDVCRTAFQAPVLDDSGEHGAALADADAELIENPSADAGSEKGAARLVEDEAQPRTGYSDSEPRRTRSWRTDDLGPDDLGLDVGGPPHGGSGGTGGTALEAPSDSLAEESGLIWTVVSVIAVAMIVLALSVLAFVGFRRLTNPESAGSSEVARQSPSDAQAGSAEDFEAASNSGARKWTDASRYSQRLRNVVVKVERVFYGAVRVKDLGHRVMTTEDENLLAVTLSVHNQSARSREFQNWYGHAFFAEDGSDVVAQLMDDRRRAYTLLKFDDVSYVEGQRLADRVRPRQMVQDTVIFLIPEDMELGQIEYFRLSLPAAAVSLSGTFRFQIPVAMIEGFPNGEGESSAAGGLNADLGRGGTP